MMVLFYEGLILWSCFMKVVFYECPISIRTFMSEGLIS